MISRSISSYLWILNPNIVFPLYFASSPFDLVSPTLLLFKRWVPNSSLLVHKLTYFQPPSNLSISLQFLPFLQLTDRLISFLPFSCLTFILQCFCSTDMVLHFEILNRITSPLRHVSTYLRLWWHLANGSLDLRASHRLKFGWTNPPQAFPNLFPHSMALERASERISFPKLLDLYPLVEYPQ